MYDAVGMIQDKVFNFDLINNTSNPTDYTLKLKKVSTTNELETSDVKCYLTKDGVGEPTLLSTLEDGIVDRGTIQGNTTINYTLRLWIKDDVKDQTTITGKSLSYKLEVEASMTEQVDPNLVNVKLFAEDNLGTGCSTYDDGTDTFLAGTCQYNYVWYSGKLWRVILKNNETGAIKMMTENTITSIHANKDSVPAFKNNYIDQWLNQEFLPTLHDYEDYLVVDSIWDASINSGTTPSRPSGETTLIRTVGLLNSYEFYRANKAYSSGIQFWLMNPNSNTKFTYVTFVSLGTTETGDAGYGVKPVVNLQNGIKIESGTGEKTNPYILEGTIKDIEAGTTLLSTRHSGDYVTFNNELYRIVDVENGLTKITALETPSALQGIYFNENEYDSGAAEPSTTSNFATATIITELQNYYNSLYRTNISAYNMIQPNTTWYLGTVGWAPDEYGNFDAVENISYKSSICATADDNISARDCERTLETAIANIGLPRVGEMFTTPTTRQINGMQSSTYTITPHSATAIRCITYQGVLSAEGTNGPGYARPSMYLKSNVVIAANNTGNGTYEKPYSIELGQ